ncbi:MAG: helix-turn-helix domain-containing protein, partial [Cetobacterium sp.]|uniref:helix-turn-helix domain-containing protein n=1 Tax=Cetobacterium sp. TaxID=2071632 RepID=UPI003EE46F46
MGLKSYDFEILDFLVRNNEVSIKELKKNMNLSISSIKVSISRINKVLKKNFNFEILISENKIKLPSEKKELLKIKVLNS